MRRRHGLALPFVLLALVVLGLAGAAAAARAMAAARRVALARAALRAQAAASSLADSAGASESTAVRCTAARSGDLPLLVQDEVPNLNGAWRRRAVMRVVWPGRCLVYAEVGVLDQGGRELARQWAAFDLKVTAALPDTGAATRP